MTALLVGARRTLLMFLHEVRLVIDNRRLFAALFGIPLAMTVLVNLALRDSGPPPDSLTIVDRDHTTASRKVATQLAGWRGLTVVPMDEGLARDPKAYAEAHTDQVLLILPPGLESSVQAGRAQQLPVFANRSTQNRAQLANLAIYNAGIEMEVAAGAAATARLEAAARGADPDAAAAAAVRSTMNRYNIRAARTTTSLVGEKPLASFGRSARFVTNEGIALIEFVGLMLAFAMVHDREGGRLTRLLWTRLRLGQLVVAKAASIFLFTALCLAAILAVSVAFGMDLGPSPGLLVVVTVASAVAITGYSMMILGIGHWAPHLIQLLGVIATVALSVFGGTIWPAESLPSLIRIVGQVTPNEWATQAYHALLLHGATGGTELWLPIAALGALGVAQTLVGSRLLVYAMRNAH
jgi:ABC-type Na+ efflux pump permease subunit